MEKIKCVGRMVHMTSFGCRHLGVPTVPPHSSWCCQCPRRDQAQLPDALLHNALLPPLPGICTAAPACTCPRALLPLLCCPSQFSNAAPAHVHCESQRSITQTVRSCPLLADHPKKSRSLPVLQGQHKWHSKTQTNCSVRA